MRKFLLALSAALLALGASAQTNLIAGNASTFENGEKNGWSSWGGDSESTIAEGGYNSAYSLELICKTAGDDYYAAQAAYSVDLIIGNQYEMTFYAKSSVADGSVQISYQNSSDYSGGGYTQVNLTQDWAKYSVEFTVNSEKGSAMDRILINFGKTVGSYYIDDITLVDLSNVESGNNPEGVPADYEVILQSNTTNGNTVQAWDAEFTGSAEKDGVKCIEYKNEASGNSYAHQIAIIYGFQPDTKYYIAMDVMGTPSTVGIGAWFQDNNYSTIGGYSTFNTFTVDSDTEWTTVVLSGKYQDEKEATRVALNLGEYVGTLYITNIRVYAPGEGGSVEPDPTPKPNVPEGYEVVVSGSQISSSISGANGNIENATLDGTSCIKFTNDVEGQNAWACQLAVDYDYQPEVKYYLTFKVNGDGNDVNNSCWFQQTDGWKTIGYGLSGFSVTSDTEWQDVVISGQYTVDSVTTEPAGLTANRIVLNVGEYVGTMYFTDIQLWAPNSGTTAVKVLGAEGRTVVYNLQGVRVLDTDNADAVKALAPGLYIVNGKKVIVK